MKAGFLCLAHALIIAMTRVKGAPVQKMKRCLFLKQIVQELLSASVFDLINGGYFKEIELFQNYHYCV